MQTVNVQFLSAEKVRQDSLTKPANQNENFNSNKDSFKSILDSVKSEKVSKQSSSDVKTVREKKISDKSVDETKFESHESEVAEEKPLQENKSVDKSKTKKSQDKTKKTSGEENGDKDNSLTVEINMEEFVSDDGALAQSLIAAATMIDDIKNDASVDLTQETVIEALDPTAELDVNQSAILSQGTEEVSLEAPLVSDAKTMVGAEDVEDSVELEFASMVADEKNIEKKPSDGENVASLNTSDVTASTNPDLENMVAEESNIQVENGLEKSNANEKVADAGDKKGVFDVIDQRTPVESSEKVSMNESSSAENNASTNVGTNQFMASTENVVQNQNPQTTESGFQNLLSQQIQNGAPEFVKAGSILLKDNNSGSINMILKPENLGNVKVSLELTDKILNGQIVVQSKEAYEAFKQNMDTLRQAFQSNGFENATLNLVLADNANSNGTFGQGQQSSGEQYMANKTYSDFAQTEDVSDATSATEAYTKSGSHQIDVVA